MGFRIAVIHLCSADSVEWQQKRLARGMEGDVKLATEFGRTQ